MIESPASVIFDAQGHPVGIILDGVIYRLQVEAMIVPTIKKQVYDIGISFIYVGTAPVGTLTSSPLWTIKRTTLSGGNPTLTQWISGSIWDDRVSGNYQ